MSWRARNGFSPNSAQNCANPVRSNSSRLTVMAAALTRINIERREEVGDFDAGSLHAVGAMHGVGVYALGKIGADGPFGRLLGVGRAHQVAVFLDGVLAFQHLHDDGPGYHEIHQILEERSRAMDRV